jgi:2-keto-3-deoxy-L-rhamnonate aldolase RhmA
MPAPFTNPLKSRLKAGHKLAGAWCQLANSLAAELLSQAGFDWLLVDLEHGPGEILTLISQIQAMGSGGALPIVRAPWNDFIALKRILDAGAYGVLVPYVNTKAEAESAVRACKYPPQGIRGIASSPRAAGYGIDRTGYLQRANDEILIITQVETVQAVANLEEILATPGLDGVFIGPWDLAASMGHLANPSHPEVQATIAQAEARVLKSDKVLGTIAAGFDKAKPLFDKGYQLVTLLADGAALANLAAEQMSRFKKAYPQGL